MLGLILLIRGKVRLLKTITAFTVAHSITLGAAALGYAHVSPPLIEALVALSIVFVAVELVRAVQGQVGLTIRYPWVIAFIFGLLHGFAFAGSLADVGLPSHNLLGALVLFNVGVEIGQVIFVGAVLLLVATLKHWRRAGAIAPYARWAAAYGIGTLASFWTIERIYLLYGP